MFLRRQIFCTQPGWCLIFSVIFFFVNCGFVGVSTIHRQPKTKHCRTYTYTIRLLSVDNVLHLSDCLRLQMDTFAALEDTEQDRACAPVGSD